jgi:hypothetical protein
VKGQNRVTTLVIILHAVSVQKLEYCSLGSECFSSSSHLAGSGFLFQINIANSSDAKYVEQIIPNRDLLAFTCEDIEDMNNLVKILRHQKNLKVNIVHSGSEHPPSSSFEPSVAISNLR